MSTTSIFVAMKDILAPMRDEGVEYSLSVDFRAFTDSRAWFSIYLWRGDKIVWSKSVNRDDEASDVLAKLHTFIAERNDRDNAECETLSALLGSM